MIALFAGISFLSLMLRGYLYGRYSEVYVDGLKFGYIPTFVGIACAVVAYNLEKDWWPLPLSPAAAFVVSECFAEALSLGRRRSGYRAIILPLSQHDTARKQRS